MSGADRVIVDQSSELVRVSGTDRVRFVQGMCMGNVETLAEGAWLRTATLNPKGRVLSVYDLVARPDDLLLICQPGLAQPTLEVLERHAIADDVAFERAEIPVYRVWDTPAAVWDAPPVFGPAPGPVSSREAVEVRRVEAGLPLFGVDVDPEHFPFETPLSRLIDYHKGCYVGQEPVARVHARGAPARQLRGLRLEGPGPAARGAQVAHPDKPQAGTVTSSVVSPRFGAIALAYLGRQAWEPGGRVTVGGEGAGDRGAEVVELPFG